MTLLLERVKKPGDRKSLIKTLKKIAETDWDFTGENGKEYLWEVAKGYKSNLDYVVDKVKDELNDEDVIDDFFYQWLDDSDYYRFYNYDVLRNKNDDIEVIALTLMGED